MSAVLWLPIGLLHVWWSWRYLGQTGRERFERFERRARAVHELFVSRVHDFLLEAAVATCLLGLLFALIMSSFSAALFWALDVLALLLAPSVATSRPAARAAFRPRSAVAAPADARVQREAGPATEAVRGGGRCRLPGGGNG
jgi:hypothetical protein